MKRLVTLAALAACAATTAHATDVGVSVSVSQPGVYGRIDIGRFPQPEVIVAQPVVIAPQPRVVVAQPVQPVYLYVPPGHQKNWGKHCHRYGACATPVYFVKEQWYQQHVMVARDDDDRGGRHGRGGHGGKGHGGKGHGGGKGRGHD